MLMDGSHDIEVCARVSEHVYATVVKALHDNGVVLEGALLKPNMIAPGDSAAKATPQQIGEYTVRTLARTIPPSMTGIMVCLAFLFDVSNFHSSCLVVKLKKKPLLT